MINGKDAGAQRIGIPDNYDIRRFPITESGECGAILRHG